MQVATKLLLLYFLGITQISQAADHDFRPKPRSIDAVLVEPEDSESSLHPSPSLNILDLRNALPSFKHLNLRDMTPKIPFLRDLHIRQVAGTAAGANTGANAAGGAGTGQAAGAQQAAGAGTNAGAQQAAGAGTNAGAAAGANAGANAAAPVAPAAAPGGAAGAPVAGVGGGAAPGAVQPGAGATANPVTVVNVQTVVNGVTKTVPATYTQSFGPPASAPPVKTGSIGMGTLTGKVGVVKTDHASLAALSSREGIRWTMLSILVGWTTVMACAGGILFAPFI